MVYTSNYTESSSSIRLFELFLFYLFISNKWGSRYEVWNLLPRNLLKDALFYIILYLTDLGLYFPQRRGGGGEVESDREFLSDTPCGGPFVVSAYIRIDATYDMFVTGEWIFSPFFKELPS